MIERYDKKLISSAMNIVVDEYYEAGVMADKLKYTLMFPLEAKLRHAYRDAAQANVPGNIEIGGAWLASYSHHIAPVLGEEYAQYKNAWLLYANRSKEWVLIDDLKQEEVRRGTLHEIVSAFVVESRRAAQQRALAGDEELCAWAERYKLCPFLSSHNLHTSMGRVKLLVDHAELEISTSPDPLYLTFDLSANGWIWSAVFSNHGEAPFGQLEAGFERWLDNARGRKWK